MGDRTEQKWNTLTFQLLSPMDRWINPTARIWRYFYDKNKDEIQVKTDHGLEIYPRDSGRHRQYKYLHNSDKEHPTRNPTHPRHRARTCRERRHHTQYLCRAPKLVRRQMVLDEYSHPGRDGFKPTINSIIGPFCSDNPINKRLPIIPF